MASLSEFLTQVRREFRDGFGVNGVRRDVEKTQDIVVAFNTQFLPGLRERIEGYEVEAGGRRRPVEKLESLSKARKLKALTQDIRRRITTSEGWYYNLDREEILRRRAMGGEITYDEAGTLKAIDDLLKVFGLPEEFIASQYDRRVLEELRKKPGSTVSFATTTEKGRLAQFARLPTKLQGRYSRVYANFIYEVGLFSPSVIEMHQDKI